jgi:alkyl sulfatase BDS1-like metallo-beta-lactamase superfamily hydrolase
MHVQGYATVRDDWLDDWVGRGRPAGAQAGGSGAVQVLVTGLPDGDTSWHVRVDDGVVAEVSPGAPATADLTLTLPAPVAESIAAGELTPSAAYMQGRMKTAGDLGLVLDVLAAVDSGD